jgi:hypothetical protein
MLVQKLSMPCDTGKQPSPKLPAMVTSLRVLCSGTSVLKRARGMPNLGPFHHLQPATLDRPECRTAPPPQRSAFGAKRKWAAGRALQEDFVELAASGLASMSGFCLERWLLAIMDISARAISLSDRPRPGQLGHQCSQTPGRPNLHLVSSSRRPRQVAVNSSCRLSG